MKKNLLILTFSILLAACSLQLAAHKSPLIARSSQLAAEKYWQQEVHYDIKVTLDDAAHSLKGFETMVYSNHSPDTLRFIYVHCWPNAYKDNTTALYRQLSQIEERKTKLKKIRDNGYIDQLAFTVDGKNAPAEADVQNADILKLTLPAALAPGKEITIATPFFVKIPSYFSRLGHDGKSYMITQWFPKPAVYDNKGWHAMPYLDQGEFYSEFGSFDVHITLPSSYVVGATGQLLTLAESKAYKQTGSANHNNPFAPIRYSPPATISKTLDYHADNVHDFAWFADQNFIIQYDTLQLASGKIIDVFSWYRPGGNKQWMNSISFIKDAVLHYSKWIGEYAYPMVSAVEGPGNTSSGGMEYPMITLITSPKAGKEELDGVIAHEVGHNWFYGMLGSNEREHPWMDEGINTYYEFLYEAEKYKYNGILGNIIPDRIKKLPTDDFLSAVYNVINQLKTTEPVETPAAAFPSEFEYGLVVYAKTAVWMHLLETDIGKAKLEKGMQAYFSAWKFRHPYPEDLQASLEQSTGSNLDHAFNMLHNTGSF
ncbi:M1 family metallopeptidase [Flavitalea sp. BT771]|uniref:M1 family metallopeptidase n=1 Tax=Flavitalea sp. BT771 TaxID=3063329 RepID=UPI0026E3E7FE|nr:M1 family metallopeptidase [Flavitalea sp. BT771]MDO6432042.1 M1 family metallopeptidase [Flavitalea sp. BT771]MDV6220951.1 M1 family metallopeptidase [Flavitalea sp. BT771]